MDPKNFKLPVIFLNLRGYDLHFIMQEIGKISKENKLDINYIPDNTEKYIAFMLGKNLVFIDSGAPARAKRTRSGTPWVRNFGKLSIPENLVMT